MYCCGQLFLSIGIIISINTYIVVSHTQNNLRIHEAGQIRLFIQLLYYADVSIASGSTAAAEAPDPKT